MAAPIAPVNGIRSKFNTMFITPEIIAILKVTSNWPLQNRYSSKNL